MATQEQEAASLMAEFEGREAGVADIMEFYEKVEEVYIQASTAISQIEIVYTSDSTDSMRSNAYLGRDPS